MGQAHRAPAETANLAPTGGCRPSDPSSLLYRAGIGSPGGVAVKVHAKWQRLVGWDKEGAR